MREPASAIADSTVVPVARVHGELQRRRSHGLHIPGAECDITGEMSRGFSPLQAKLEIGDSTDALEREADAVANRVVQQPGLGGSNTIGQISGKQHTADRSPAPAPVAKLLGGDRNGGRQLDRELKSELGEKMNADFSSVRVHDDGRAHHLNRSLGARAFTHGRHIYFNSGQFQPSTKAGRHLLVHELTHTLQQGGARQSGLIQRATVATVVAALSAAITAGDKPAYMDALRTENAAHVEDASIYTAIEGHFTASDITLNEAWQAVCILNYGNDTVRPHPWPVSIRNFFEGLVVGEYSVTAIAPRRRDEILQQAVSVAHTEITTSIGGRGRGPFSDYTGKFNALWGTSTYAALSSDFDRTMDSRGPRTERSRRIFEYLHNNDLQVASDYDNDVTGLNRGAEKMRQLVDQYVGPESRNLVASPRIQRLREAFFSQPLIRSNNLANPAYSSFKTSIRPFAEALDETDRQEIENSHQWRSIIDWTVSGNALREDLAQFLQTAFSSSATPASTNVIVGVGTNIAGTAARSSSGPVAPVAPAPALTPDQQIFVDNITLQAANTAIPSVNEVTSMALFGRSTRDEAGLALRTRVVIDNPANHRGGTGNTIENWPSAATTGTLHRPRVTTGTGRGTTTYNAALSLEHPNGAPIARTGGTAIPPLAVMVTDNRYSEFIANMTSRLFAFFVGGARQLFVPGATVNYFGGQAPLDITPRFDTSAFKLPEGLTVYSEAEVTQNGNPIRGHGPTRFPDDANGSFLGRTIPLGPAAPPAPDAMIVDVDFRETSSTGPVFHNRSESFDIDESVADAAGTAMPAQLAALSAQLSADKLFLNTATPSPPIPASGTGTVVDEMIHHGTPQSARIAQTVLAGTIVLEPMIIRPDSADFLATQVAAGHNRWSAVPSTHVIFALTDSPLDAAPLADPSNSVEESPRVGAIQWNNKVYIHLTTSLGPPSVRLANFASIIGTIVHEAVHLVDIRPGSGTEIERYRTEFRAYWMDGERDHLGSAFDPAMDNFGPRSEKSRAIFEHLYRSATYDFVKDNYDPNTRGFRDQVNAYIVPDGINLLVSQKLEEIRSAIVGFSSSYGAAQRTRINDLYNGNVAAGIAVANADERREISGNQAWRSLVERMGFSAADLTDIKNDLGIPV
jgi:hypothetical protein